MKIKTDFITNSSSASFIIAVKKGSDVEDIQQILLKNKNALEEYFNQYIAFYGNYDDKDFDFKMSKTKEEKIELLAYKLAERMYAGTNSKSALQICDFGIYGCEGDSESEDLFRNWLYSSSSIDTEILKIVGFD